MKVWREFNADQAPLPGVIWFFEDRHLQVGVRVGGYCGGDAVASISVAGDLSAKVAELLARFLYVQARRVCRLTKRHRFAVIANVVEGWSAPLEQCRRCYVLRRRDGVLITEAEHARWREAIDALYRKREAVA